MSQKINVDGVEYDFESLSPEAKAILEKVKHTETQIQDKQNLKRVANSLKK